MTSRRRRGRSGSGGPYITPTSHISMTIIQMFFLVGGIATVVLGYAAMYWQQNITSSNVLVIKTNQDNLSQALVTASQTQDTKREQLGKDFLAAENQIVDKVATLNTTIAVTQEQQKQMTDALTTISNQLGEITKQGSGLTGKR